MTTSRSDNTHAENYTTAAELLRLLEWLWSQQPTNSNGRLFGESFGSKLCEYFKLDGGPVNVAQSWLRFVQLCARLFDEVSKAQFPQRHAEQIRQDCSTFVVKLIAVGPNMSMRDWYSNIDKPTFSRLTFIDMALIGRLEYPDLESEAKELLDDLVGFRDSILNSGLPGPVKLSFVQRLADIENCLLTFRALGEDAVRTTIEGLAGALVMTETQGIAPQDRAVLKRVAGWAGSAMSFANKMGKLSDDSTKLVSSGQKLLEFFRDVQ